MKRNLSVQNAAKNVNFYQEYEEGVRIQDLFIEERHCRILFPRGVQVEFIAQQECLKQCLEEDSCESVNFKLKNRGTGICHLNIETKYDACSYYICGDDASKQWHYFEKAREYFVIFSKNTGQLLFASDQRRLHTSLVSSDGAFWFWSGNTIRSKKYPDYVLTVGKSGVNDKVFEISLGVYKRSPSQKWTYEKNFIKSLSSSESKLLLSVTGTNKIFAAPENVMFSQRWSLSLRRNYFILTNRGSGNVLTTHNDGTGRIVLSEYHGEDNQLWFWDDNNLRSKKFPSKVLQIENMKTGEVTISNFNPNKYNQLWEASTEGDTINLISSSQSSLATLCEDSFSRKKDGNVIICQNEDGKNDRWSFALSRVYFFILHKSTGKVITVTSQSSITLENYDMKTEQLWFWDGETLRSKMYTDRVLTSYWNRDKIEIAEFTGKSQQRWSFRDDLIVSKFENLKARYSEGCIVASKNISSISSDHLWSITISHDFFTIWNKNYGIVLNARSSMEVVTNPYEGGNNQLWFWDNQNIRSKKYPDKLISIIMGSNNRLVVQLQNYTGYPNQKWIHFNETFISDFEKRKLSLKNSVSKDALTRVVACNSCGSDENTKWSYSARDILFFGMYHWKSKAVLVYDENDKYNRLKLQKHPNGGSKFWFYEGNTIRSKLNPRCVLTLQNMFDNWYKLKCDTYKDPPESKFVQSFGFKDQYIFADLEGFQLEYTAKNGNSGNYIGGFVRHGQKTRNQILKIFLPQESEKEKESHISKVEARIYEIAPLVPLVYTVLDLGSSIGYAAGKGNDVAQQRALSLAMGIVTDNSTGFIFATGADKMAAFKTGVKMGLKFIVKAGIRNSINIAKTAVKNSLQEVTRVTFKTDWRKVVTKIGVFLTKETLIDPTIFLKNIGKVSYKLLIHTNKTFLQNIQYNIESIGKLESLKQKLIEDGNVLDVCKHRRAAKRGRLLCINSRAGDTGIVDYKEHFERLKDATPDEELVKTNARRYLEFKVPHQSKKGKGKIRNNLEAYNHYKKHVLILGDDVADTSEMIENFAIYQYTEEAYVNKFTRGLYYPKTKKLGIKKDSPDLKDIKKASSDTLDEKIAQSVLIQSYLKKNAVTGKLTVTRFEPSYFPDRFPEVNGEYVETSFFSTSKSNKRKQLFGTRARVEDRPRVITIHLNKYTDISAINPGNKHQDEVLIPFGTTFRVKSRRQGLEEGVKTDNIELEEVAPSTSRQSTAS